MSKPIIVQLRGSGFAVEFEGLRVSPFYRSYAEATAYINRSADGVGGYDFEDFPT